MIDKNQANKIAMQYAALLIEQEIERIYSVGSLRADMGIQTEEDTWQVCGGLMKLHDEIIVWAQRTDTPAALFTRRGIW